MIEVYDFYTRLEPNHEVWLDNIDEVQRVRCPFIDAETTWSLNADPDEVECLFCKALKDEYPTPPEDCGV